MVNRQLPRGVLNRNPLNIEHREKNKWLGLADPPTDGRYARYIHPIYGLRAGLRIMRSYEGRGIISVGSVIAKWAPKEDDNPVTAYVHFVTTNAGVAHSTYVLKSDRLAEILLAMTHFEQGIAPYRRLIFVAAIELFFNEDQ